MSLHFSFPAFFSSKTKKRLVTSNGFAESKENLLVPGAQ